MVLRRSESAKTTLSMYITRTSKYQKYLGMNFVILLLGSLTMIFFGVLLKLSYYMDQLDFLSIHFALFPWMLIGVGVVTFLYASFGFLMSTTEQEYLVGSFGFIAAIICLLQFATVFVAMEARGQINSAIFTREVQTVSIDYDLQNPQMLERWDFLQSRLRCCGAFSYTEYLNVPDVKCVPESCCFNYQEKNSPGCTGFLTKESCKKVEYLADRIFMIGCMKILRKMYERDLVTLLLFYGIGGTIMALIELISAALSFAYMGQIHRRQKREWTPGEDVTAGNGVNSDGMPMDDFPSN